MAKLQVWDGTKWLSPQPKNIALWDGSKWTRPNVRVWDGKSWGNNILETKVTKTWNATWDASYESNNNINWNTIRPGHLAQGKYGSYDPIGGIYHNPIYWGRQRSLVGFDVRSIQDALIGSRIEKIEIYLHSSHSWYVAGATASIGIHGYSARPNRFDNYRYNIKEVKFNGRDHGQWIELDPSIGVEFASGKAAGISLYKESDNLQYYGFWHGSNGGSKAPKLRVTYYTNSEGGQVSAPNTPKQPAKYTTVLRGEGLVQVVERLMRAGELGNDFFANRELLMRLNGFSTSAPILQIGQQIMYKAAQ